MALRLQGDEAQVFARMRAPLRSVVKRRVDASDESIADACSFAWLQFLRRQPPRDEFLFAWLITTAVRIAWRLSERDRRERAIEAFTDDEVERYLPDPRQSLEPLEVAWDGLAAVATLRPRQRQLVGLQAAGFTYEEIGAVTGDSYRTVDRQLHRATTALAGER
jgi:RNA polymerase sigma factor (sigma-70 family)